MLFGDEGYVGLETGDWIRYEDYRNDMEAMEGILHDLLYAIPKQTSACRGQ